MSPVQSSESSFYNDPARTGGGGWGHLQGAVHMAAARFDCKRPMVDTELANSRPGCTNRCRKRYSHHLGGSFLAGKTAWTLSGYLPTENVDCCMLLNEWAQSRSKVCLLRLKVHLGSVLESGLRQK